MKKMVILGNGFDLGGELPTKYEDYFKHFKSANSEVLGKIDFFLNIEKAYSRELEISEDLLDFISLIASDKTISIWDLYFWHSEKDSDQSNNYWSDVEIKIDYLIKNISSITFITYFNDVQQCDINKYSPGILHINNNLKNRLNYLFDLILIKRYGTLCESEYLSILKRELLSFEENFREYISKISKTQINEENNLEIYRDNFFKVTNNEKSDFIVINFNYTDFSGKQKKKSVSITRDKKEINVEQMNVHGVYYSKIIFGIDQTDQDEKFYQFTKTYRKMELYNEIPVTKMPERGVIDEIIIYGHSLSKADYSYFHSIFDYYDIYDSGIIVSFVYSLYGDKSTHENKKNEYVQNVMKLLRYYGDKMFDRERGKNLVHKMLLENRLRIREVELNPLEKLQTKDGQK